MFRCSICAEGMLLAEDVSSTVCGHIFHTKCFSEWLDINANCPQCRTKISKVSSEMMFHRVYLPEQIRNKEDIMEKVADVTFENEMLKKSNVDLEKKFKKQNKEFQNSLNKKKKDKKAEKKKMEALAKLMEELDKTPNGKTQRELRAEMRRSRSKSYFSKKKERCEVPEMQQ